jgi:hypothetical protein
MSDLMSTLRDYLSDGIEALTPVVDATRSYQRVSNNSKLGSSASSNHRKFWFELSGGGNTFDFEQELSIVTHAFAIVMAYNVSGKNEQDVFDAQSDEVEKIIGFINCYSILPAGIDYVRCDSYAIQPADGDSDEIVFACECAVRVTR